MTPAAVSEKKLAWLPWLLLAAIASVLFVIRITAPTDLLDAGQQKPAAYALDIVKNHHWLCQRDESGDIMSKPPLYNWLAGLSSLALGRVTMFSLCVPIFLATLGIAWLIFAFGRKHFGFLAGFLGALGYLISPVAFKQMTLARTDGLFSLLVMVAALCALDAWLNRRSWTWFWLAAAAATMTKGPLGVVLAAGGLLAAVWEWRSRQPVPVRGNHFVGVALFLLIGGGWFALAYHALGQPLIDKMIGRELFGHALQDGKGRGLAHGLYIPFLYFLSRLAPWSLLACAGFWRVCRRPAADLRVRRVERFLFCWFFAGLAIFSVAAHRRADLLFPLMPAAALLAGREWAEWMGRRSLRTQQAVISAVVGVGLVGFGIYQRFDSQDSLVQKGERIRALALAIKEKGGDEFPLTHVDNPVALQFFLNTMRLNVSREDAVQLLSGDAIAFVAVASTNEIVGLLKERGVAVYEVGACEFKGKPFLTILSNHPTLELTDKMSFMDGDLTVQMEGARLAWAGVDRFGFSTLRDGASVSATNRGKTSRLVRFDIRVGERHQVAERTLAPGETWRMSK